MAYTFEINKEAIKRQFSAYVVVVASDQEIQLYVGKTDDNREGCNPVISRCGNHFSYNKIHSQIRNKITDHELQSYTYVFDHFGAYPEDIVLRRKLIDQINEMERYLNCEMQKLCIEYKNCIVVNEYKGSAWISPEQENVRNSFRTKENAKKINGIVHETKTIICKALAP